MGCAKAGSGDECGRVEQRTRLLPARVVVYFVLAMCSFFGQGYEEVARLLVQGLEREGRWATAWRVPTTAAIGRARLQLGPEPLRALFGRVCGRWRTRGRKAPGTGSGGWSRWTAQSSTFRTPRRTPSSMW
ncbi:transposase domain-containing protein [Streptomyces luomodiensis]|uniref:transposase domain-containing protein n=1 Tax=Streptomyces luomodiensis TaxID=3026192 RepID=UPI003D78514B